MFFYKKYIPPTPTPSDADNNEIKQTETNNLNSETLGAKTSKLFEHPSLASERLSIIILGAFMFGLYMVFTQRIFFNFFFVFLRKIPLEFSAPDAAFMLSMTQFGYAISLLLGAFIALKVSPRNMIIASTLMCFVCEILMYFATNNRVLLWIGGVGFGYGMAGLPASILAFFDTLMPLTNQAGAVFILITGILNAFVPYLVGFKLESFPLVLIYSGLVGLGAAFAAFVAINVIVIKSQRKLNVSNCS